MKNFEILDAVPPPPRTANGTNWARPGHNIGAKPAGYEPPQGDIDFNAARARNELAKAQLNELDLEIKSGKYVARAAVQMEAQRACASITQTLRSIPDLLERRLGIDPMLSEEIGRQIDDALQELATEFEAMGGGAL